MFNPQVWVDWHEKAIKLIKERIGLKTPWCPDCMVRMVKNNEIPQGKKRLWKNPKLWAKNLGIWWYCEVCELWIPESQAMDDAKAEETEKWNGGGK